MYHPFICYMGVALTFIATFALFKKTSLDAHTFFYVPVVLQIIYYTAATMWRDRQVYQPRSVRQALTKSIGKYVYWLFFLAGVIWFYQAHPAYRAVTPNTRLFFEHFLFAFILGGLPYFYLEEKYRYCRENVLADPYLKVGLLVRCAWRRDFRRLKRRLVSRRNRGMLLSALLRIHYIPIMFEQVHYGVTTLTQGTLIEAGGLRAALFMLTTLAWLIDSNNASTGYFWQSAFTKTRFRAIDPHPTHWMLVLACYPPFIYFVNSYLAMFPSLPENAQRLFSSAGVNTAIDVAMLTVLILYMLSGCTLGFACSNLSYKHIQTRGPYRFMRHPATTFKLIFFTLAFYRFAPAYSAGWFAFYLFWIAVYVGRALVEERFLRRFDSYRAYMKQTKYRFIPGLV